jgi:hypothetical protein
MEPEDEHLPPKGRCPACKLAVHDNGKLRNRHFTQLDADILMVVHTHASAAAREALSGTYARAVAQGAHIHDRCRKTAPDVYPYAHLVERMNRLLEERGDATRWVCKRRVPVRETISHSSPSPKRCRTAVKSTPIRATIHSASPLHILADVSALASPAPRCAAQPATACARSALVATATRGPSPAPSTPVRRHSQPSAHQDATVLTARTPESASSATSPRLQRARRSVCARSPISPAAILSAAAPASPPASHPSPSAASASSSPYPQRVRKAINLAETFDSEPVSVADGSHLAIIYASRVANFKLRPLPNGRSIYWHANIGATERVPRCACKVDCAIEPCLRRAVDGICTSASCALECCRNRLTFQEDLHNFVRPRRQPGLGTGVMAMRDLPADFAIFFRGRTPDIIATRVS